MTTTDDRHSRTAGDLLPFLPLVLIITMFGVAVAITQVAPSRVTSGDYEVTPGEGQGQFRLASESLSCGRTGDTATCTAPVAGRELTVDIKYGDPAAVWGHTCTARHGDRPVSCMPQLNYGHAAASVRISDSLGVTEPELIRLRDAVPWWRTGNESSLAAIALLCMLAGAAAGVTTYLLSKRARPEADESRFRVAVGSGLLGLAPFVVGSLILTSERSAVGLLTDVGLLLSPVLPVLLASALLMAWRYQLGGAGGHGRGRRVAYAIGGAMVTAFYTAVAMAVFLQYSGFVDWLD